MSDPQSGFVKDFPPGFFDGGYRQLRTRSAADLAHVRPIDWLWRRYLPNGYLSLLIGAEGIGKGTLIAHLVGAATRGELSGSAVRTLIAGDEDAFYSVVVPRLMAANANLELVDTIHEEDDHLDLRADAASLRALIESRGYGLVVFDAMLDALGDVDAYQAKAVREEIRPLRRIARDLGICALGLLHPNKGARASFRELVSGSHAFNALARSSLLLAEHPSDSGRRLLVRGKGNLSQTPPGFEFRIESTREEINGHTFDVPVVADAAESELTIADVLASDRKATVRDGLAEQIDRLGPGPGT